MRIFLVVIGAFFAIHFYFNKDEAPNSGSEGSSERGKTLLPPGFDPSKMTSDQKAKTRAKLTKELARVEKFIANPPI